MSAGSLGRVEFLKEMQVFSVAGGTFLPAPSTENAVPQDDKLSARPPSPLSTYKLCSELSRHNTRSVFIMVISLCGEIDFRADCLAFL